MVNVKVGIIYSMKKIILMCLMFVFVVGCASSSVNVMKFTTDVYPQTLASHIKIHRTMVNDRAYIELAEISTRIKKSNQETVLAELREKAAELGADALILTGERSLGSTILDVGNNVSLAVPRREICAIAIKYE